MNVRRIVRSALAGVIVAFGLGAAHADEPIVFGATHAVEPIERSGNVYHRAVCSRAIGQTEMRCHAHMRVDVQGNPFNGRPDVTRNVTPSGYGPSSLRSAYNVTATGSSATTIAIVDAYGYANAEADLAVYRAQFGLPSCTTANGCFKKVNQSGSSSSYPPNNTGWAQEQALDLDMASAMCPNCKILLVQATSATYGNLATAVNTAANLGAKVISNSYGGGEVGSTAYNSAYTHTGVAITASTGDSGYGAQFPAVSPGVIAVGGTTLTPAANSRGWSETTWSGTGSGCSSVYAKPAWQHDGLCTKRMEADISAVADPNTGVAVYGPSGSRSTSSWLVFGGTSVAAPLIGGIYGALGIGAANGAIKIWPVPPATASGLHDVTSGKNGSCGGTYFCTAGSGYDGPTGWGTPNGSIGF